MSMQHLMNTYGRQPVSFARGEGVWLWDLEGRRYLDGLSGIAVTGLGHAHPAFVRAITEQVGRIVHASNLYRIPEQEKLADKLCAISGMDAVFFCNSGCEANEAAIKLARLHGHQRQVDAPAIIVMEKSFHGRTMATLSATGSRKVQAGFEPLLAGFVRVPFGDQDVLEQVASRNPNIVAVLVEPVQGEGGINIADAAYLVGLRQACDRHGWLLMLDEVQSGMARTGRWFAHQLTDIKPDVMTLAKGLGNGFPIGACLARGPAAQVFKPGSHGSTFGGNPMACVAAYTTLSIIEQEKLLQRAEALGRWMLDSLDKALTGLPGVVDVRGKGLMIGIELDRPCSDLVKQALDEGLLINVTADNVVRLLPALVMPDAEAEQLVNGVVRLVKSFVAAEATVPG
jgi:acetylornithine aminotransferase